MKLTRKITEDIIYVGGEDRKIHLFEHHIPIRKGVTYNSYLILDEKTALMDTADQDISRQFIENVEGELKGKKLDYLIIHHREPDHCYNINEILLRHPETKLVGNRKTFLFLHQFFPSLDTTGKEIVVKEGDVLNLGKHSLKFYRAPRVHWPEVRMSFEEKEGLLFTADAFGTFDTFDGRLYADEFDFDNEILDSARKYYTNIVGKYGPSVLALFKKLPRDKVNRILPLHGPLYRTKETRGKRIEKYSLWASYTPEKKGVRIYYSTRYGDNREAAQALAIKLNEKGIKNIHIFDVSEMDIPERISKAFEYSNLVFIANTYNAGLFLEMENLINDLIHQNIQKRTITLIQNGTWAPTAAKVRKDKLSIVKTFQFTATEVTIKSAPNEDTRKQLDQVAEEIVLSRN